MTNQQIITTVAKNMNIAERTASIYISCKKNKRKSANSARQMALDLGYKTREARRKEKEMEYLRTHNFPSKEAETLRMEYLREQGYSNAQIARKIGRSALTVRRRIGVQSKEMTIANVRYAMQRRAADKEHRRQIMAAKVVRQYNEKVTEMDAYRIKAEEAVKISNKLREEVEQMRPEAVEAAKVAGIAMIVPDAVAAKGVIQ